MDLRRFKKKMNNAFFWVGLIFAEKVINDNTPALTFKRIGDFLNKLWYATLPLIIPFLLSAAVLIIVYSIEYWYQKTMQRIYFIIGMLFLFVVVLQVIKRLQMIKRLPGAKKSLDE